MFFLDLASDPASTPTQRNFANNVFMKDFAHTDQNKGGSAKTNKKYAAYESSFLRAIQFASAKAFTTRHLASGNTGDSWFGNNSGGGGSKSGKFPGHTPPPDPQQKNTSEKEYNCDKDNFGINNSLGKQRIG